MITTEEELYEFVETLRPLAERSSADVEEMFDTLMYVGEPWEALTVLLETVAETGVKIAPAQSQTILHEALEPIATSNELKRYSAMLAAASTE